MDYRENIVIEVPLSQEEKDEFARLAADSFQREYDAVTVARSNAYSAPGGSDGIFFQYQRGEKTEQEWLDAVQAINDANPYPVAESDRAGSGVG